MITLASIITQFKDPFLKKYKDFVLPIKGHYRPWNTVETSTALT